MRREHGEVTDERRHMYLQGPQGPVAPISVTLREHRDRPGYRYLRRTPEVVLGIARDDVVLSDTSLKPVILRL